MEINKWFQAISYPSWNGLRSKSEGKRGIEAEIRMSRFPRFGSKEKMSAYGKIDQLDKR